MKQNETTSSATSVEQEVKESILKCRDGLVEEVIYMVVISQFLDFPHFREIFNQQLQVFKEDFEKYTFAVDLSGLDEKEAYSNIREALEGLEEAFDDATRDMFD